MTSNSVSVKLDETIYCRVDGKLKRKLGDEVKRRRERGHGAKEADVTREALIEYFDIRERNGKAVAT